jgi:hypothetical protein
MIVAELTSPISCALRITAAHATRPLLEYLLGDHYLTDVDCLVVGHVDGSLSVVRRQDTTIVARRFASVAGPRCIALYTVRLSGVDEAALSTGGAAASGAANAVVAVFEAGAVCVLHSRGFHTYSVSFPLLSVALHGTFLVGADLSLGSRPLLFDLAGQPTGRSLRAYELTVRGGGQGAAPVSASVLAVSGGFVWLLGVDGSLRRVQVGDVATLPSAVVASVQGLSLPEAVQAIVRMSSVQSVGLCFSSFSCMR